jgi:hypothetical protein
VTCGATVVGPNGPESRPPVGDPQMFTFSFPFTKDGYLFYGDIHSGLYVVKYTGPHRDEVPAKGLCVPNVQVDGYDPCPPYGRTNWGTPGEPEPGN